MRDLADILALYRRAYQAINEGRDPHLYSDGRGIFINDAGPYRPRSVEKFALEMLARAELPGASGATG